MWDFWDSIKRQKTEKSQESELQHTELCLLAWTAKSSLNPVGNWEVYQGEKVDLTFMVVEWVSREWGNRDSMKPTFLSSILSFITQFVKVEAGWPNRCSFLEWLRRLTPVITQESRFTSKFSWPVLLIRAGRASDTVSLIAQAHQEAPEGSCCPSPWVLMAGLLCCH